MLPKGGPGLHALKEIFEWSIENNDAEEREKEHQPLKTQPRNVKPKRLEVTLVKDSPWLAPLRHQLPHILSERFSQTFLRFLRDDTLVGVDRIAEVAAQLDLPPLEFVPRLPPSEPWREELPSTHSTARNY